MRLKHLGKQEFELDVKLKEYQKTLEDHETGKRQVSTGELALAQTGIELTLPKLRQTQKKLYGWRSIEAIYEKNKPGYADYLQEKVLDLEQKQTKYERIIKNYKTQVEMLEAEIAALTNATDGDENRLREAKQQLLDLHKDYHIAETGLPLIQAELEKVRKELEQVQEGTKQAYNLKETYESISAEIHGRGQQRARERGIDYALAVSQILREDPELARRYVFET